MKLSSVAVDRVKSTTEDTVLVFWGSDKSGIPIRSLLISVLLRFHLIVLQLLLIFADKGGPSNGCFFSPPPANLGTVYSGLQVSNTHR